MYAVLANSRLAGLLATDDIGVVSLLLFWGMVELSVGMIAICLPTLRPLFEGCSVEFVGPRIRAILSLPSMHTGGSEGKISQRRSTKDQERLGLDSSTIRISLQDLRAGSYRIKNNRTRAAKEEKRWGRIVDEVDGVIRVDRDLVLSCEVV